MAKAKRTPEKLNPRKHTQVFNAQTGHYWLRDTETGLITDVKRDGSPYEGIRIEKSIVGYVPGVKKSLAQKAERAVLRLHKRKAE